MRTRALGAAPRPATMVPGAESLHDRADLAASGPAPTLYAGVTERRSDGCVSKLYLPAPTASSRVPYLVPTMDGGCLSGGWVTAAGDVLRSDLGQPAPPPGAKLLAVTDRRGRILCVRELPTSAQPKRRSRSTPTTAPARSRDRYAHDPTELCLSGTLGRVLRVHR